MSYDVSILCSRGTAKLPIVSTQWGCVSRRSVQHASYALLTHLIAHETGLAVGEFVHTLGDAHLYINHIEQMKEQLSREIRAFPTLVLNQEKQSVFDFEMEDIQLEGYDPSGDQSSYRCLESERMRKC